MFCSLFISDFSVAVNDLSDGYLINLEISEKYSADIGIRFVEVYEGMIVGENNHDNDLAVNVVKGKNLTNTRSSSKDHTVVLKRPRTMSLEICLDYIKLILLSF